VGLEPQGVGGFAGARVAPARRGASGREAGAAADGVPDVLRGDDRAAVPDRAGGPAADLPTAVVEPMERGVPEAGGATARLLAVLKSAASKPGSGCPGPRGPSDRERGWGVEQRGQGAVNRG